MTSGSMVAKYGAPMLTALAVFDWQLAGGIGFGLLAGWAGAASMFTGQVDGKRKMRAQLRASLMASGICLLIVLWAVRLLSLDPLGAATVAAGVGVLGVNAVEIFRNGMRNWVRSFIETASDALGESRQMLAKEEAARSVAEKSEDIGETVRRLEEAEARRLRGLRKGE